MFLIEFTIDGIAYLKDLLDSPEVKISGSKAALHAAVRAQLDNPQHAETVIKQLKELGRTEALVLPEPPQNAPDLPPSASAD